MKTVELLKKLTAPVAVSGAEKNFADVLRPLLESYGEVSVDCLNNVCCHKKGEGAHFLLDAHIDEIGFIVKEITDQGYLKVANVGGIDRRMLLASEVSVWGDREYFGVVSTLPPHLQKNDDRKAPEIDDIAIDVGLSKEQAEKGISLGDRVTFKRNFVQLAGDQICSSVLDDRSGVCAVILALEYLKNTNAEITAVFSSQEEVGTRGAKIEAYGKAVDEAIVVDVSFGYSPMCKKSDCGEIGKGSMIGISPILNKEMSEALINVAGEKNIPYQIEVMGGGHTGTNADVISICEYGIKTALVSIPEKYMHSPVEIVDTNDVESTAKLIAAYIEKRLEDFYA